MLTGVIAFNVLKVMPVSDPRTIGVLLVGYLFQGNVLGLCLLLHLNDISVIGIGLFMTLFYLAIYLLRIITTGFMSGHQANGAFVACGPPGFTALALIHLGREARRM